MPTHRSDWFIKFVLLAIAIFLGLIAARPFLAPETRVAADSGRFDYASIISATFLYNGRQGILLLDKRNGNVWFLGRNGDNMTLSFADPVFVVHVPLEKLDGAAK
jgi:hypothetical protein